MKHTVCRICGSRIVFKITRYAWVHVKDGADHGPVPV